MEKFQHKKSLGQNFLKDENVLKKIAGSITTTSNDLVVEVGPGQGALTKYLVQKDSELVCFEIDTRVKTYLNKYENDKCHIIYDDFMKVNVIDCIESINKFENVYFIANIPYYITTPILEKIMNLDIPVAGMVLMVQKEVAERFAARPGTKSYGSLTVYINYYYDTEYLFDVHRTCFDPIPNVDSAVVKFTKRRKKELEAINEEFLFKFINDAFQFKRKNLRNNLKHYDLDKINAILEDNGYNLLCRAEQIPIIVFVKIANALYDDIK